MSQPVVCQYFSTKSLHSLTFHYIADAKSFDRVFCQRIIWL